jgi:hypothetical protein
MNSRTFWTERYESQDSESYIPSLLLVNRASSKRKFYQPVYPCWLDSDWCKMRIQMPVIWHLDGALHVLTFSCWLEWNISTLPFPLLYDQGWLFASLQQNAKHPETFTPLILSLKPVMYSKMIHALHLPTRAIEGTSCVGPLFWAAIDQDDKNPHLRQ